MLDSSQRGLAACAVAACFGTVLILHASSSQSLYTSHVPTVRTSMTQPLVPRSMQYPLPAIGVTMQFPEEQLEEMDPPRSFMHSTGITALCLSAIFAAAGAGLKLFSHFQARTTQTLSFMEMMEVPDPVAMLAATSTREKKKLVKAKKKTERKEKKEQKEKPEIILTPQQVKKKMRKACLRIAKENPKKPLKTTGRVCMLLGKVDNRRARSISFSHIRTHRVQRVNLHWQRMWWEEGKCFVRLRLSTKGIKTITRYGLHEAAKKFNLDLTRHMNGVSERKYVKYLPEKEKKAAMLRDPALRHQNLLRMAMLRGDEPPPLPAGLRLVKSYRVVKIKERRSKDRKERSPTPPPAGATSDEPQVIAMAISHGVKLARLGRPADQRKALLRSLTTSLIRHGRIKTTIVKARALRKPVEHMITLAKEGSLHSRRQALAYIYDKELVKSLFEQVPTRYADRPGGYTRITRTMPRKGDAAKMCYIELL